MKAEYLRFHLFSCQKQSARRSADSPVSPVLLSKYEFIMEISQLLREIKDAAYEVRLHLAPGFLESVYQNALQLELRDRGLSAEKEVPIPVMYKQRIVGDFRADLLVNNSVIIELKAVKEITPIHEAQLVNYLTATGLDYGYIINYGGDKYRIILKTRLYNK